MRGVVTSIRNRYKKSIEQRTHQLDPEVRDALAHDVVHDDEGNETELAEIETALHDAKEQLAKFEKSEAFVSQRISSYRRQLDDRATQLKREQKKRLEQQVRERAEEDEDEEEYVDSEEEDDVEEVGDNRAVSHPFIRLDDCTKCLSIMMSTDPLVDNVGEYQKLVSTIHKVPKATVRAKSAKKKSKNKNHVGADDASSVRSIEKEVQEKLKFTWSAIMNRDGIDESLQEYHNEQRKMADDPKKFDEDVAKLRATEETLAFVLTAMTDIEKDFDCVTAENLKRVDSAQIEDSDDESSDDCSSIFSLSADSNDSTIESEMFTASLTEYSHVEAPKVEVDCNMLGGLKPKKKGWFSTRRSKKSGKNASKRN
mmetsp:Transcript_26292/g.37043  ORF Transcript_26292/g.37043 Transcript_26292/m.37043 type:complete len:369 (-) Transcript_26292:1685-2791(-)